MANKLGIFVFAASAAVFATKAEIASAQSYAQFSYTWPAMPLAAHRAVISALGSGRMQFTDSRLRGRGVCTMTGGSLASPVHGSHRQNVFNYSIGASALLSRDTQNRLLPGTPCMTLRDGRWVSFGAAIRSLSFRSNQVPNGRWIAGGLLEVTLSDGSRFKGRFVQSYLSIRGTRASARLRAVLTNAANANDSRLLVIQKGSFGLRNLTRP